MGRPKKAIDYDLVQRLAHIQCTQTEIAAALGLSVRTLERDQKFCQIYKTEIDNGRKSLRRLQWESARGTGPELVFDTEGKPLETTRGQAIWKPGIPPSVTMQIWLGKQYLGQVDKSETDVTSKGESITPSITVKLAREAVTILRNAGAVRAIRAGAVSEN
jgi:hypothetical protein